MTSPLGAPGGPISRWESEPGGLGSRWLAGARQILGAGRLAGSWIRLEVGMDFRGGRSRSAVVVGRALVEVERRVFVDRRARVRETVSSPLSRASRICRAFCPSCLASADVISRCNPETSCGVLVSEGFAAGQVIGRVSAKSHSTSKKLLSESPQSIPAEPGATGPTRGRSGVFASLLHDGTRIGAGSPPPDPFEKIRATPADPILFRLAHPGLIPSIHYAEIAQSDRGYQPRPARRSGVGPTGAPRARPG